VHFRVEGAGAMEAHGGQLRRCGCVEVRVGF